MNGLATYDGGSGVLVDTNVWIDCMDAASPWYSWSVDTLQTLSEQFAFHINIIISTELLVPGSNNTALNEMLGIYDVQRSFLPWPSAVMTAEAFRQYRLNGGERTKPMPDFYLGAHAAIANLSVMTRDIGLYKTYYPKLRLVSP